MEEGEGEEKGDGGGEGNGYLVRGMREREGGRT